MPRGKITLSCEIWIKSKFPQIYENWLVVKKEYQKEVKRNYYKNHYIPADKFKNPSL
jgi:hypothetical protein